LWVISSGSVAKIQSSFLLLQHSFTQSSLIMAVPRVTATWTDQRYVNTLHIQVYIHICSWRGITGNVSINNCQNFSSNEHNIMAHKICTSWVFSGHTYQPHAPIKYSHMLFLLHITNYVYMYVLPSDH
jgi:hypothetical protein